MSDYAALLRAVLVSPDDDLPRLVLCDWLEEHGEAELAKSIRTAIADGSEKTAVLVILPTAKAVMRRGFVDSIALTRSEFVENHVALFSASPISAVRFVDSAPMDYRSLPNHWSWSELVEPPNRDSQYR